jgi:hypothetical protein
VIPIRHSVASENQYIVWLQTIDDLDVDCNQ